MKVELKDVDRDEMQRFLQDLCDNFELTIREYVLSSDRGDVRDALSYAINASLDESGVYRNYIKLGEKKSEINSYVYY